MRRLVVVLWLVFTFVPCASAGGDRTDLVVHGGTIWAVGDFGVRAVAASSAKVVYAPRPRAARYELGVAVAGGAAFVASVANGFANGEVVRIDVRTHARRIVWHRRDASAQYVAAGAGGVYVLVGAKAGNSVVRLSLAGRVTRSWPIVDAGRIAADASGCWVAADHRLLHIRPTGSVVEVLTTQGLRDVATGGGAAWLLANDELTRIDERTGVVRGLRASGLLPLGANHELAVGAGALWTATSRGLQRRSLRTGALERTVAVRPNTDAVAVAGGAIWVASGDELVRLDPRSLRVTRRVWLV